MATDTQKQHTYIRELDANAYEALKEQWGYENPMAAPRLEKVVVSVGTGSLHDKGKADLIQDRLARITGQKAAPRPARKSIASFRTREGDIIGYQVTLRGTRMYDFLEKLLRVGLPRARDFRGLNPASIDEMGNITLGVSEHTTFPETPDEELKDVFGFSVTVVTTAQSREEARAFLEHLGFPFKGE